jgi:hypothetical protein
VSGARAVKGQVTVDRWELELALGVQFSGGDVQSTELESVVYGIDERDKVVRKDDYVIEAIHGG